MPTGSDAAYLDASALVKLALAEPETTALRRALGTWPRRVSSVVSAVEVARAVRRRDARAEALARELLAGVSLVRIGNRLLAAAAVLDPPTIRSLDAIHLASALRLGRSLAAFVSYDRAQLAAAEALEVPVVSPR